VRLALIILLCMTLAPAVAAAQRPDSDAPTGADPSWLPSEPWVMERWMPFDEDSLLQTLDISRPDLYRVLKYGRRNLGDIARSRGVPARGLIGRLLASRRGTVDQPTWRVLRRRTARMLDQRHLAEHVIGHTFHHWSIWLEPDRIWGPKFDALNQRGLTAPEISRKSDLAPDVLRHRVLASLAAAGRRGLAQHALSVEQERSLRRLHRAAISELVAEPVVLCAL
jgi:hypothetical protein